MPSAQEDIVIEEPIDDEVDSDDSEDNRVFDGNNEDGEDNVESEEESAFHDDPVRQSRHRSTVTVLEFAAFRLHSKADSLEIGGNRVLLFRRLTQEYMVDMFGTIEFQRLDWLRYHQIELCLDLYQGLQDAMT